jgi:hypothetical protein
MESIETMKINNESGIEIMEQLMFDGNDEVRDLALNIMEKHFDIDTQFYFEDEPNKINPSSINVN